MTVWLPLVGYEGLYEISDDGRIRSLRQGREMNASPNVVSGHLRVNLTDNTGKTTTRTVHSLVLETFVGPRPLACEGRHLDDDPSNNSIGNLAWGTRRENMLDRVKNGIHNNTRKTHCPQDHEYTEENTMWVNSGRSRACRICKSVRKKSLVQRISNDAR